jgi:isocitrate lyase
MKTEDRIQALITDWTTNPRWKGIERPYTAEKVVDTTRFLSNRTFYCSSWLRNSLEKIKQSRLGCRIRSFNRKSSSSRS